MPLYDFQCVVCDEQFESFLKLKDCDCVQHCPDCGGEGRKIITSKILRDEPTWLNADVTAALMDREDPMYRPIETRTEYNRYLKDNGIMPIG